MSLKLCKFEQFLYINFKANKQLYSALYALLRDYKFDLFTEDSQRFKYGGKTRISSRARDDKSVLFLV